MNKCIEKLLNNNFKDKIIDVTRIEGGWLTDKWKIKFENNRSIMIKVVDYKKIKRRNLDVELAYNLLDNAYNYGVKCPKIYKLNNQLVNYTHSGKPIIITEYIENTFLKDHTNISKSEIFLLGKEIAKMRKCFDRIEINKKLDLISIVEQIKKSYIKRVNDGKVKENIRFLSDVYKQKEIIDLLNVDFLKQLEIGYCHRDLSQDNILFDNSGFNSIIDFELANVSFVLIDIARVFLTFCLDNSGNINKELLNELLKGYNTLKNITINDLVLGIKILWYIEVELWSKEIYYVNNNPEKVNKFINEINWITNNWDKLNDIIK